MTIALLYTSAMSPNGGSSQNSSNLKFEVFMHPVISMICWLVLGTWLLPAFAHPAEQAEKKLRGSWAATKAERDGKAVDRRCRKSACLYR